MKLLTTNNAKTIKGEGKGWRTGILYLQPCTKLCPFCSKGCKAACLNTAGRGQMTVVQVARRRKTEMFFKSFDKFSQVLLNDIRNFVRTNRRNGLQSCVRLNGTSDVPFEMLFNFEEEPFTDVVMYDYTKNFKRCLKNNNKKYYLLYSRSEDTKWWQIWLLKILRKNTAVVFKGGLPKRYLGIKVIDGDKDDLRFLDKRGVIVGLKAKGKAKQDKTGFVVDLTKGLDKGLTKGQKK